MASEAGGVVLWDRHDDPSWWLELAATVVAYVLLMLLLAWWLGTSRWSFLGPGLVPFLVLTMIRGRPRRVRLTADGVELRRWTTQTLAYADIETVEVAPEWEGPPSVWLRMRQDPPHALPDKLVPPSGWLERHPSGLADTVAAIRARVDRARSTA